QASSWLSPGPADPAGAANTDPVGRCPYPGPSRRHGSPSSTPNWRRGTYPPPYPPTPAPDPAEPAAPTTTPANQSTTTTTTTEEDPGQAGTSTPADPPTTTATQPRPPWTSAGSTPATNAGQPDPHHDDTDPCPGPP